MQKTYRAAAVTGLVGVCATGMSVLGAGSASAAPAAIPLDSCKTTVQANVGDSLTVTAKTVLAPQLAGLRATPVVGPPAADALGAALSSMKLGALTVTQSTPGDPANISGADSAKAVAAALPPLVPAALVTPIVTNNCGITVTKAVPAVPAAAAAPAVAPSTQNAPPPAAANPPANNLSAPTAVSAPAVTSYGHAPKADYSDITSVPAGGAGFSVGVAPTMPPKSLTGYGLPSALGKAPTMAPQFGLLAAPPAAAAAVPAPTSAAAVLPMMSEVTALPTAPNTSTRVPAEAVIAALLLSLTTAALVRTWVLRRSSH